MRIRVSVKPNSKRNEILSQDGDKMKVAIAAPPDKNKANLELIKFLSKKMGRVKIISGFTSREKILELQEDS